MRAKYLLAVAVAVVTVMFCGTPAWADSTLHIGTGIGTVCQAGCAGDPNLIGSGSVFDVAQVSEGANSNIGDLWVVLAVPNDSTAISGLTLNGLTGTFEGLDTTTDIYSFLGSPYSTLNNSNNLPNLEGADSAHDGITATGYGVYLFNLGEGLSASGFDAVDGVDIPTGTFAVAAGYDQQGKLDGTPFTEAGLTTGPGGPVTTPEPGGLVLLGIGLLSVGGILRRRVFGA
jgi:hypothetical protein